MKIFGIGLSRTGTSTLAVALGMLGYRTVHFPQSLAEIDAHEAATDASVAFIYKDLDRLHPGSKFVLTLRPTAPWLASCEWHFGRSDGLRAYDERMRQVAIAVRMTLYDGVDFDAERFARCYARHVDDVRAHFAGRPADLLTVDLCTAPDWRPLCTFLGKPVPRARFPWANRRGGGEEPPRVTAAPGFVPRLRGALRRLRGRAVGGG